jgi:hypothetical protein
MLPANMPKTQRQTIAHSPALPRPAAPATRGRRVYALAVLLVILCSSSSTPR